MKRGFFRGVSGGALLAVVLCLIASKPIDATTFDCEPREARVLYVDNDQWQSDLTGTSASGATVRLTDCAGLSFMTAEVAPGGAVAMEDFPSLLCSPKSIVGIARLPIKSGCAHMATEAIYADSLGNFNIVYIPELGDPLEENVDNFLFAGIRSELPRSTFVLLVAEGGPTRARVTLYGSDGNEAAEVVVGVGSSGWAWYAVPHAIDIGSATVRNLGPGVGIGSPASTHLYAYAFAGWAAGGSPREIAPQRLSDATATLTH